MSAGLAKLIVPIVAVPILVALVGWFGIKRMMSGPPPSEIARNDAPNRPSDTSSGAPSSTPEIPGKASEPGASSDAGPKDAGRERRAGEPIVPSFDVVRVEPSGDSVIAGRAAPGATVDLLRNGQPLARIMADQSGLFAFVPPPLPPGSHEIVLQTIAPDGSRARSNQSVSIVIADKRDARPLVAVTTPGQPTVVLSRPESGEGETKEAAAAPGASGTQANPPAQRAARIGPAPVSGTPSAPPPLGAGPRPELRILSVEAEGTGRLYVSGSAAPGATLRLYLNEAFVAPGSTGPDGRLSFVIERGIRPGEYRVRLDDVDPVSGSVRSRAEVPFTVPVPLVASVSPDTRAGTPAMSVPPARTAGAAVPDLHQPTTGFASRESDPGSVVVPEVNTAMVSRGDNLWRISKRTYGNGLRYTVIYGANQPQIRNPSLIYPGQMFVLPADQAQAAR
jgi:nucleoid-associated protein YgaU